MLLPTQTRSGLVPKVLIALIAIFVILQCTQLKLFLPRHSSEAVAVDGDYIDPWFQDAQKHHSPIEATPSPPSPPSKVSKEEEEDDEDVLPPSRPLDYNKTFVSYGTNKCLPVFNEALKELASKRNQSCAEYAPFNPRETRRVGFASITTGKKKEAYQRAIESQMFHAAVHGSSAHILCDQLADSTFNKIAFLLNLVMNELLKPASERLEWIMWTDRDAIVLDMCRPLSSFLPPKTPAFSKVNMLVNNDGAGLNNGVFLFKVNRWSLDLFNSILAYPYFEPEADLTYAEQSAQQAIMSSDKFSEGTVRVPWHWFNAFPDEDDSVAKYVANIESDDLEWFRARKGDFIVHFAGDDSREERMIEWEDMLRHVGNVWEDAPARKRDISNQVARFWKSWEHGTLTENQISGEPEEKGEQQQQQLDHVETRERR